VKGAALGQLGRGDGKPRGGAGQCSGLSGGASRTTVVSRTDARPIPEDVLAAIADLEIGQHTLGLALNEHWGEPGLSYGERLFGWNTLEVLALDAGNPQKPINAIPPRAQAFAICVLCWERR